MWIVTYTLVSYHYALQMAVCNAIRVLLSAFRSTAILRESTGLLAGE